MAATKRKISQVGLLGVALIVFVMFVLWRQKEMHSAFTAEIQSLKAELHKAQHLARLHTLSGQHSDGGAHGGAHRPVPHHEHAQAVPLVRPNLPAIPPYLALFEREKAESGELYRDKAGGGADGVMKWQMLSREKPRLLYIERFWNDDETEVVLGFARKVLSRSMVVASKGDAKNSVRTSEGMFITDPSQTAHPVIQAARRRVSLISGLPEENIEATQVLRYQAGQRYLAHPDYFDHYFKNHLARGGQRVATLLSWLTETKSGGNTSFPMARRNGQVLQVPPKKGDAILFYSCEAELKGEYCTEDPYSQHQGNPPDEGSVKWVAVFWIRQHRFQ